MRNPYIEDLIILLKSLQEYDISSKPSEEFHQKIRRAQKTLSLLYNSISTQSYTKTLKRSSKVLIRLIGNLLTTFQKFYLEGNPSSQDIFIKKRFETLQDLVKKNQGRIPYIIGLLEEVDRGMTISRNIRLSHLRSSSLRNPYIQRLLKFLEALHEKSFREGFTEIQQSLYLAEIKKNLRIVRGDFSRLALKTNPQLFHSSIKFITDLFENFGYVINFGETDNLNSEEWHDLDIYRDKIRDHYRAVVLGLKQLDREIELPSTIKVGSVNPFDNVHRLFYPFWKMEDSFRQYFVEKYKDDLIQRQDRAWKELQLAEVKAKEYGYNSISLLSRAQELVDGTIWHIIQYPEQPLPKNLQTRLSQANENLRTFEEEVLGTKLRSTPFWKPSRQDEVKYQQERKNFWGQRNI